MPAIVQQIPDSARIALSGLALLAAGWDLKTRTIPNWLTVTAAVVGLVISPLEALKGIGLGLLIQLPFFYWGKIGGGDVKLLAAAGALAGWKNMLFLFFTGSIVQGLIAAIVVASHKGKTEGVPRGPSFLVAVLLLFLMIWANA
jgi:Flp pilus assembly protein protease CpaA